MTQGPVTLPGSVRLTPSDPDGVQSAKPMHIDPATESPAESYKILTNVVVPRPIAWITTRSAGGVINLAPFSFFNAVGGRPPCIIVSIGLRDDGTPKDTARNIEQTGEFVVNAVTEDLLHAMNISAVDFPPDQSELVASALHAAPSLKVSTPRLAESQVSLECRLLKAEPLGTYTLYIAEVVMFHVADHLVGPRRHIEGFAPLGRMGSPSVYCRTADRFELPRMSRAQWQAAEGSARHDPK
jgi:flavin reductase (DIM6/NTAB) family NADH-FMN oxidoreductase RutF